MHEKSAEAVVQGTWRVKGKGRDSGELWSTVFGGRELLQYAAQLAAGCVTTKGVAMGLHINKAAPRKL